MKSLQNLTTQELQILPSNKSIKTTNWTQAQLKVSVGCGVNCPGTTCPGTFCPGTSCSVQQADLLLVWVTSCSGPIKFSNQQGLPGRGRGGGHYLKINQIKTFKLIFVALHYTKNDLKNVLRRLLNKSLGNNVIKPFFSS